MFASNIPAKFPIAWASGAGAGFINPIPTASQIATVPGAASLTDGLPPLNFQPVASGGIPPRGKDFNGLFNQITAWNQWQAAGGSITFDAAFAAAINGYPRGAVLMSAVVLGNMWMSTVDNNMTDPDSNSAANWISPPGLWGTGALGYTVFTALPTGWVWAKNAYTIGNPTSGASYAAADASPLYSALWNGFPNSQCGVTGGRGANPAADFAAGKSMQVLDIGGSGIIGQDNATGRLTSVPVISGNPNAPGALIGENQHPLAVSEIPSHSHSGVTASQNANHYHSGSGTTGGDYPDHAHTTPAIPISGSGGAGITTGGVAAYISTGAVTTGGASARHTHIYNFNTSLESAVHQHAFTTDGGTGGGGSHNTVHRSMTVNWMLKL